MEEHAPILRRRRRRVFLSLVVFVLACVVGHTALLVYSAARAGRQGFGETMALRALWNELSGRADRSEPFPDSIVELADAIPELRAFAQGASRRSGAWESIGTTRVCLDPRPWKSHRYEVLVVWSMVPALYSRDSPRAMTQFADSRDHTDFLDLNTGVLAASLAYYDSLGIPMPEEMVRELWEAVGVE